MPAFSLLGDGMNHIDSAIIILAVFSIPDDKMLAPNCFLSEEKEKYVNVTVQWK